MGNSEEESSSTESETSQDGFEPTNEEREEFVRKELGDIPFEDLEKLSEKVSTSRYAEAVFGSDSKKEVLLKQRKQQEKSGLFAENRKKKDSRPMEMSSKKRVSRFRNVVMTKNKTSRDPRFDDLSGNLNLELFKKSYGFLDNIKKKEKKAIKLKIKKEKNTEKKAALHKLLQRMEHQEACEKEEEERKSREREVKKKEIEAIQRGKNPFYLKKSQKKKLELAEKYKNLKETGKLDKYLTKKRKRNAAKDRKNLPQKRSHSS